MERGETKRKSPATPHNEPEPDAGPSIHDAIRLCLSGFHLLLHHLLNYFDIAAEALAEAELASDSLGLFKIWLADVGAPIRDVNDLESADRRLRDTPEVAALVLGLLKELQQSLSSATEITNGSRVDQSFSDEYVDSDGSESELENETDGPSELQVLLDCIQETIASLFKASHVGEKFPKIARNRWLQDRLGRAITQRRESLRYCRDQHDELAHQSEGQPIEQMTQVYRTIQADQGSRPQFFNRNRYLEAPRTT